MSLRSSGLRRNHLLHGLAASSTRLDNPCGIDGRGLGDHDHGRGRDYLVRQARGVAAMVKNLVAGCVVVALIFMILLAYAQEHHECWEGHLLKTLKPCGSLSTSM
jgi:hypothetical protein